MDGDKLKHFANLKPEFEYRFDVPDDKLKNGVRGPIMPDGAPRNTHRKFKRSAISFKKIFI